MSNWHQKKFLNHATQVLEAQHQMINAKGKNVLHYILQRKRKYRSLIHYPLGDRIDNNTGAQYFYHCHRENLTAPSMVIFIVFYVIKKFPARIKPAAILSGINTWLILQRI